MPAKEPKLSIKFLDQLGERFVEEGLISQSQLDEAFKKKEKTGEHLGEVLLNLSFISPEKLNEFIAKTLEIPFVDLQKYTIDPKTVSLFDQKTARRYKMIPLFKIEDTVTVAMVDPLDIFAIDNIKSMTDFQIEPVLASEENILQAMKQFYGSQDYLGEVVEELEKSEGSVTDQAGRRADAGGIKEVKEQDEKLLQGIYGESDLALEGGIDDKPIIKIVNSMISQGVKEQASDIHIEPEKEKLKIRFRIDGFLCDVSTLSNKYHLPIVSRIKILAKMDIGQKRKPQDGKIHMNIGQKKIDLRVSTYPVIYGEKVAIRILDWDNAQVKLDDIGFCSEVMEGYSEIIKESKGIVLVTGPTGSGKTTTLYATINTINSEGINITTIEDPIEYQLENVNQGNVDEKAGITFPTALRTILRQDPDVIMVGEVRDMETAQLAIRAALTGHLVFSTLHTNDAPGAVFRLLDMGVEPFLLSSSIKGILAQRLVRMVCKKCREPFKPDEKTIVQLGLTSENKEITFFKAKGCPSCRMTGYKGRTGIFELLIVNEEIGKLILEKKDSEKIKQCAIKSGMRTLQREALQKVLDGVTTLEEAKRVTDL
jgi:type IV pilus assembly protein PilB